MKIKTADIKYREDLYPRFKPNAQADGIEVTYRHIMNDVAPEAFLDMLAGKIANGVFYPYGSVAAHFFRLQRQNDRDTAKPPHVYFIRSQRGGPVKIGMARHVASRLESLQTAHPYPLEVIATIPHGGRSKELELHKRFANYRLNGEWFEWNVEIEEFINSIQSLEAKR